MCPSNPRCDLAVAYRVYPGASKRSPVYAGDKLRMAELCARSFKESLGSLRVKMWVVLDSCPESYAEVFQRIFRDDDLELVRVTDAGNAATFALQVKILAEQTASPYVYFAEDDYVYLPGRFESMLNLIRSDEDVDVVTPYDHPANYALHFAKHAVDIRLFGNSHWRRLGTTCLTFLTRRSFLAGTTRKTLESFSHGNFDASLWLALTKYRVFRPDLFLRYLFTDRLQAVIIGKAWLHCWRQILFGSRYTLWGPIPSTATHLESTQLAPAVEWQGVISRLEHA